MKKTLFVFSLFFVFAGLFAHSGLKEKNQSEKNYQYLQKRGNLFNSYNKLKKGEPFRVAFLGGSITEMDGWRNSICETLKQRFPSTEFDFVAAGIGSTGTTPGAFRLEQDVLSKGKVDLLFVEAAVNDDTNGFSPVAQIRGMEGEVRHALLNNPEMDIIMLHFISDTFIKTIEVGGIPEVIQNHEKVADYYQIPSVNLAKEITLRMKDGQFDWDKFGGIHPSPFGHTFYAAAITRLLDEMWAASSNKKGIKPHSVPAVPLDKFSYYGRQFVNISEAVLVNDWALKEEWTPGYPSGTRAGFVKVPMLEALTPDATLKLQFKGTAIGLFCVAGPEAGIVEYSIDGSIFKSVDTYTAWSGSLYIPWVFMLDSELENKEHQLLLRMSSQKNPKSKGYACQIRNFVVNIPEK